MLKMTRIFLPLSGVFVAVSRSVPSLSALSAWVFVTGLAQAATLESGVGMAMHGEPKYKSGFQHLDYADSLALKGGTLTLGSEGTFDTLNPFTAKGAFPTQVATLVFQELGEQTLDEPFTTYPGVAESFELAPDKLSMIVKIRPQAKFSDGKPVTADDIVFSFKTLTSDKGRTLYKFYWSDIKAVTAAGKYSVKFEFARENPELALITTQLPVIPKHIYSKGDFAQDFATRAVGSGPYTVKDFKAGSYIVFKRNPAFWGKDAPLYRGRYNYDEIVVKYFKDPTAEVEAFKKGDFDIFPVFSSKVWALDLVGDRIDHLKWIKKALLPNSNNQGSQGFGFNIRLPIFQDVRIRQAMALAFDFDWSNKNLFYSQYVQNESFFENSPLKATGLPGAEELAVLEPFKADIPSEVFTKEMGWLGKGKDIRERLKEAVGLIKEAGYTVKDGVASGPGGRLEFKFLIRGPGFHRVIEPYLQNLKRLGILVTIEEREDSVYIKRLDNREFDMTVFGQGESQSPGNEQRDYWGSKAADEPNSNNVLGIKNKAVDALVDKIVYAKARTELEIYTRALDRVLYHLHPVVHNWHLGMHRIAYWDKFGRPANLPKFYSLDQLIQYMWIDPARAKKLDEARSKNAPLL